MIKKIKQHLYSAGILFLSLLAAQSFIAKQRVSSMSKRPSSLVLYYSPSCPYCHKVMDYMEKEHIEIEKKNVQDPGVREQLISIGGKGQVPCLVIDGKALYESNDIINWMAKHKAELSPPQDA